MNNSQVVVGVSRTLQDIGQSTQWNKKLLTWVITHNTSASTRQHTIELQMTIISSERIVRVDGEVKHRAMVSFGFKVEFNISNSLKGAIQQDGFTFELFVNGRSFTELQKVLYAYQPPKLDVENFSPKYEFKPIQNHASKPVVPPSSIKIPQSKAFEFKGAELDKKKSVEQTLKDNQDQLLRIMIEQKRKKKLNQQKSQ